MTDTPDTAEARDYLIIKGGYYYRPNRAGYTSEVSSAGRYTQSEAEREARVEPWHMRAVPLAEVCPSPGGYPADIENPDEWAAFLARYLDNRVTNGVHNGIGLVAMHIVDAIKGARENASDQPQTACGADHSWESNAAPETGVLRALAGAVDDLMAARHATKNGLLDDHCANALREIKIAMKMAIEWGA